MDLRYRIKTLLAELWGGAGKRADVTDPHRELSRVLGTPVMYVQELGGQRRLIVDYFTPHGYHAAVSDVGSYFNLDLYKYLYVYGKEPDYIQMLALLRSLLRTSLSPVNVFSVIYPLKQGYALFYNVAAMTHRKLPYTHLYEERFRRFVQRATAKHSELINLMKEDFEVHEPTPEENLRFVAPQVPPSAGKMFRVRASEFVRAVPLLLSTRYSRFYPFLYVGAGVPQLVGLYQTPSGSAIGVFYLDMRTSPADRLVGKVRGEVLGTFVLAWKVSLSADYLKVSKTALDLAGVSPELAKDVLVGYTPTVDIIQERMQDALNEVASYVFTRSSVIADVRVFVEHNVVEKDRVEHYLYLTVAPRSLSSDYYAHDVMYTVETAAAVVEAKLQKMMAEGKLSYAREQAEQILRLGALDPILFLKKLDQILGAYPFPRGVPRDPPAGD